MITVDRLIWDKANVSHIARHGVTQKDVEEICQGKPVFLSGHSGRMMAVEKQRAEELLQSFSIQNLNKAFDIR